MDMEPNLDLLRRQRTFSIDETRAQLQQGRPVQREAVVQGAVDYGTLMYGDNYHLTGIPSPAELLQTHSKGVGGRKGKGAGKTFLTPDSSGKKTAGGSWAGVLMNGVAPGSSSSTDHTNPASKSSPGRKPVNSAVASSSSSPKKGKETTPAKQGKVPKGNGGPSTRGIAEGRKAESEVNVEQKSGNGFGGASPGKEAVSHVHLLF